MLVACRFGRRRTADVVDGRRPDPADAGASTQGVVTDTIRCRCIALPGARAACGLIRRSGACDITFSLVEGAGGETAVYDSVFLAPEPMR